MHRIALRQHQPASEDREPGERIKEHRLSKVRIHPNQYDSPDQYCAPAQERPERMLNLPEWGRTGSVPAATVWSKTLNSFSLSNIISSRERPVRSNSVVSSIASHGHACSHMPQ